MNKKTIFAVMSFLVVPVFIANAVTTFDLPPAPAPTKNDISLVISRKAFVYNVSAEVLHGVVKCESNYDIEAENINKWESSYGLVQINLLAHPEITKEQAFDPEFAIDYLAKNISKGKGKQWSCYKKVKNV